MFSFEAGGKPPGPQRSGRGPKKYRMVGEVRFCALANRGPPKLEGARRPRHACRGLTLSAFAHLSFAASRSDLQGFV